MRAAVLVLSLLLFAALTSAGHIPEEPSAAKEPIEVRIALQLDQISGVDQKAENFSIVGNFIMGWNDPSYAFDPVACGCDEKVFNARQFEDYARNNELQWPQFLFYNQQGNRWIQERIFEVKHDGDVIYFERFSATLQAPDFDFLHYPFDTQKFSAHIVSLFKDNEYFFVADPDYNRMGSKLGEEEWLIGHYQTAVESIVLGRKAKHSRFTYTFSAKRHVDYYINRIFLPLFLIIMVAYATFFMKDYAKRVDYSAANLLTFVMFNFAIGSDLPRLGYLTFVDSILVMGFVITAVTVIANVAQKRLAVMGKEDVARRWDGMILLGYPILYVIGLGFSYFKFFR